MAQALKVLELEEESTVTSKGQTTVPKSIRDAMGLAEGDRVSFSMGASGVTMRRVASDHEDPAIGSFLSFLANDMESNPRILQTLSPTLLKRIEELTAGVDSDADAPIEGDVAI
jgi:antitoxin PrlF